MTDITSAGFLNQVQVPQTATSAAAASATDKTKSLGKQDFLKLLMAQMRNQDPMKPMDDSAMIAQMAQFSALEATQQLQQTIQQSNNIQTIFQAGGLIGKYVQANQSDGSDVSGAVTGVDFTSTNGVVSPTLKVNGQDIDYSTILKVSTTPIGSTTTTTPSTAPSTSSSGSAG